MSNNKQSSVEWLDNELASLNFDYLTGQIDNKEFNERHKSILEQAKTMHKEELEFAFKGGMSLVEGHLWKPSDKFEEFYNEKFGDNNGK